MRRPVAHLSTRTHRILFYLGLLVCAIVFALTIRACHELRHRSVMAVPLYKPSDGFGDPRATNLTVVADPDQLLISCDDPPTTIRVEESADRVILHATVLWDRDIGVPVVSGEDDVCAGTGELEIHRVRLNSPLADREVLQNAAKGIVQIPSVSDSSARNSGD